MADASVTAVTHVSPLSGDEIDCLHEESSHATRIGISGLLARQIATGRESESARFRILVHMLVGTSCCCDRANSLRMLTNRSRPSVRPSLCFLGYVTFLVH